MGDPGTAPPVPVARWPEEGAEPLRLAEICEKVLEEPGGLLGTLPPRPGDPAGTSAWSIAYPVLVDGVPHGVVAFEVAAESEARLVPAMNQLQWGVAWLELAVLRRRAAESAAFVDEMKSSFDLLAAVVGEDSSNAVLRFVTELATRMQCDRVSLGTLEGHEITVRAISHSAQFDRSSSLVRLIGRAMEESVLQRDEVVFPPPQGGKLLVTKDHEALSREQGGEAVLTIPVYSDGRYLGAVTLERPDAIPFREAEAGICRGIVALVSPILELKRQEARPVAFKLADSGTRQVVRLFGPRYPGRKLALLLAGGVAAWLWTATGDYRITATALLEPSIRRSVVSPFNGYVKEALVRPGDIVRKGKPLVTLDDRDLHLERAKWQNQMTQYERQRQEAAAANDRAKANIIASQFEQATAQLDMVERQLKRTNLVAPFDGIVVSGDLSQRIDGAVEQGEVLFEVAPLNAYRVILQVVEYRIGDVRPGQTGELVLPARTDAQHRFTVEKVTPISSQKEGQNYFRVEARLDGDGGADETLRPGMEGAGKIRVDRRKRVAIWTRDLVDWARLKVWSWWP
jgi:RND family efflux transporter MFP subunit